MKRVTFAVGFAVVVAANGGVASAVPPSGPAAVLSPAVVTSASPAPASPAPAPQGVAVLATPGATDATWPLAQAVYADASLRAPTLDEDRARVLCGEAPKPDAPAAVRDLAATVAAVHGDDAPSRALLADIAHRLLVRAVVVVGVEPGRTVARVFLADTGMFDAARYESDAPGSSSWSLAVASLARSFAVPSAPAPALATHPAPAHEAHPGPRPFYLSPWFWGAVGLAAAGGLTGYLVSRDTATPTVHLEVQVPHE